jgi:hypothetical protein
VRLLRRKESGENGAVAVTDAERDELYDGTVDELRAEIEELERANRARPDRTTERRLLRLRHVGGMRLVDDAPAGAGFADPDFDALPGGTLPEIAPSELTPGLLRAGILRGGCLLVRGLVPRGGAVALAEEIDRAFAEREKHEQGGRPREGYYEEFRPHSRYGDVFGRSWIRTGGGVLAADAPMLSFQMTELFRHAGLRSLVSGYLGEPALISVHKTTLRKADPQVPGAWHQDGFFMGPVRSLNLWLSLSRCGDEAPGLDILPRRLEEFVATNTDGSPLNYTISDIKVSETAGDTPILRPVFEPGDALFFDEMFLHQTGSDPAMLRPRFAIENWFFGGSAFPEEYAPMLV